MSLEILIEEVNFHAKYSTLYELLTSALDRLSLLSTSIETQEQTRSFCSDITIGM